MGNLYWREKKPVRKIVYNDIIDHEFKCNFCNKKYELEAETYYGQGGVYELKEQEFINKTINFACYIHRTPKKRHRLFKLLGAENWEEKE